MAREGHYFRKNCQEKLVQRAVSEQAQGLGSVRQAKIWKKSTRERKQQV